MRADGFAVLGALTQTDGSRILSSLASIEATDAVQTNAVVNRQNVSEHLHWPEIAGAVHHCSWKLRGGKRGPVACQPSTLQTTIQRSPTRRERKRRSRPKLPSTSWNRAYSGIGRRATRLEPRENIRTTIMCCRAAHGVTSELLIPAQVSHPSDYTSTGPRRKRQPCSQSLTRGRRAILPFLRFWRGSVMRES